MQAFCPWSASYRAVLEDRKPCRDCEWTGCQECVVKAESCEQREKERPLQNWQ